jgi:hypothetical protein
LNYGVAEERIESWTMCVVAIWERHHNILSATKAK